MAGENPIISGMAGRYAGALFELARNDKAVDAVKTELERFDALVAGSPDFSRLVRSPVFGADEQLKAVMPGPAIALRTFPQNDEIVLFAEVYDNAGSTPHKVDITATVTADEGKVMFTANEARDSSDLGGQRGGYGYTTKIPLKDLAPGSYVLKVEAKSRLGQTPPVARELQFAVEAPRPAPAR